MTAAQHIYTLYPFMEGKTRAVTILSRSVDRVSAAKSREGREVQKKYFERYATTIVAAARSRLMPYPCNRSTIALCCDRVEDSRQTKSPTFNKQVGVVERE